MIDNLNGLLKAIKENAKFYSRVNDVVRYLFEPFNDCLFCPQCGDNRRASVNGITRSSTFTISSDNQLIIDELPWLLKVKCLQCESEVLLLLYDGTNGYELACLHNTYGGCFTPHTPNSIKYYLDQAFRARSVGAVSASMSMYRSALEWVLYDQGYTEGMLESKIKQLEKTISENNAPKWALDINTDFLRAIKGIGNGSIHTNGGDISKQNAIDNELLELVDIVFSELLDKIYEQPVRSQENLKRLQIKSKFFKK